MTQPITEQDAQTAEEEAVSDAEPVAPPQAPEAAEADSAPVESEAEPAEEATPNAEAAKYRRRLRDTEAERDELRERLTVLQKQQVEYMAHENGVEAPELDPRMPKKHYRMADGSDLWRYDVQLADLVGADGQVDPEKVGRAVAGVLTLSPHLASIGGGNYAPLAGKTSRPPVPAATFLDAAKPKRR